MRRYSIFYANYGKILYRLYVCRYNKGKATNYMKGNGEMRKTKIVCTLGPATDNEDVLRQLMQEGMDGASCNVSHGVYEDHKKRMDMVKKIRKEVKKHVAILLDTKGPEVRVKQFKEGKITLKEGQLFTLTSDEVEGTEEKVSITYNRLYEDLENGMTVLIDDGLIEMRVEKVRRPTLYAA